MTSTDTEFTAFKELGELSDDQLEKIYLQGDNLHISSSKASAAKRLLDLRARKKTLETMEKTDTVVRELKASHKKLLTVVEILTYIKRHWFPYQPLWFKILIFLLGTIVLGVLLNLTADWIAKFILHW